MISLPDDKHWDARWDREQRAEAARLAHDRVDKAQRQVDGRRDVFEREVRDLLQAVSWYSTVERLRALADAEDIAASVTPSGEEPG